MTKTRGFTNSSKGFLNRHRGVMKKANMLSKLTDAHMAVLCEYNGEIYIYQSDKHFSLILNSVRAGHMSDCTYLKIGSLKRLLNALKTSINGNRRHSERRITPDSLQSTRLQVPTSTTGGSRRRLICQGLNDYF
jgi:hypothetical protein